MIPYPPRYEARPLGREWIVWDTFTQEPVNTLEKGRPHLSLSEILPYRTRAAAAFAADRLNRAYEEASSPEWIAAWNREQMR